METRIVKENISIDKKLTMANVSEERWHQLSLAEQLGNIGSEVGRAAKWQGKDEGFFWSAVSRALELFDLTQSDRRWGRRHMELNRAREFFADAVLGGREYGSTVKDLEKYFMPFALRVQSGAQSLARSEKF